MSTLVTERDLANLATVGFDAPVRGNDEVVASDLAESVVHVLDAPSARLVRAATLALLTLAADHNLGLFLHRDLSDEARRRLGFLTEVLSQSGAVSDRVGNHLLRTACALRRLGDETEEPLTLMAACSSTLMRSFVRKASPVSKKWGVFANVELPPFI